MTFIRTVLGDIPPESAGRIYSHEHIIIDPSYPTEQFPEFELSSVNKAVKELVEFREAGGGLLVDTMPCDCGRNILKLADVSSLSRTHIVCPTGLHLSKYYPNGHWSERRSSDELSGLFIADILDGVDENDYGGPCVDRTPFHAGVIKVAAGTTLSDHEIKVFRAAAKAHRATGCPIITHTEEGRAGIEQAKLLIDEGVDPAHIVLSHTDRQPDTNYHRALLATGVNLEYDSAFRWKSETNPTTQLIVDLVGEFPNQLLLGMDAARSAYWQSYGGKPGLTYLLTTYCTELETRGVEIEMIDKIFLDNPASAYSFCAVTDL